MFPVSSTRCLRKIHKYSILADCPAVFEGNESFLCRHSRASKGVDYRPARFTFHKPNQASPSLSNLCPSSGIITTLVETGTTENKPDIASNDNGAPEPLYDW